MMKLIGAFMIMIGCGGSGFALVAAYRYQEQSLLQLTRAVEFMICELQYRMTPLPELCSKAATVCTGCVKKVLNQLHIELEMQVIPDAATCMQVTIADNDHLPERLQECMELLGNTLGRFDLPGQLQGLESVKKKAAFELEQLRRNQDVRFRCYRTLGICAGAALVILLI